MKDDKAKVKVTDKRRVRPAEPAGPVALPGEEHEAPSDSAESESPVQDSELEAAQRETAEYRDHLQRLQAEFDNYRKRVLKEQTVAIDRASEPLVSDLLEVLDEFDLALMAAEKQPDFDRFVHGVELVYAKLTEILRSAGVERIEAEGRPFDPEKHEALMQSGDGDAEAELVVADVLRPGYTLKGRVIRPAGVKVTRGR